MYNLTKLKILVIGPQASGKTAIVNYLSHKSNALDLPYRPTCGVRVVESQVEVGNRFINVQLWDVAGNPKNDRIWPAIMKQAQGCLVVFNGDNPKSQNDAQFWIQRFPKALNMPIAQCIAFSHHLSGSAKDKKNKNLKSAPNMKVFNTCIEEGSSTVMPAFDAFLKATIESLIEKQQKEEQNLMNQ